MCGRLEMGYPAPVQRFISRFTGTKLEIEQRFNLYPTLPVPVIWLDGVPKGGLMTWGITPRYWRTGKPSPLANARDDTVWKAPNFRPLIARQHCVIVANGFYEWQVTASGKQPWHMRMTGKRPLALAGLWQEGPQGLECCIITTSPNAAMEPIHNRMPVILDAAGARAWLEAGTREMTDAILVPCPAAWIEAKQVSNYVNSPRNEGQRCIEPPANYNPPEKPKTPPPSAPPPVQGTIDF